MAISIFRELEESLMAGLVPSIERWHLLTQLSEPWGSLSSECIQDLRKSGCSLLPTLRRLRQLAENHQRALEDAKAKSSQAFAQAMVCSMLAPLLGSSLYFLLPGIAENTQSWMLGCTLSLILSGMGAIWLLQLADSARWGGFKKKYRQWSISSECAGERLLALIRAGTPPDLAWNSACSQLAKHSHDLASAWGYSVWDMTSSPLFFKPELIVIEMGNSIKKSIQVSLMEGKPCLDRVESMLLSFRHSIQSQVEKELSLLGTRSLKPLFIFIAPSVLGLLVFGLWITFKETTGGILETF